MPRAGALASGQAERQQCAVQAPGEHQGIARARNHTCSELSSVLSTRTRVAPLSVAETTSVGSSRSWRVGAIVTPPRARGVVFSGLGREHARRSRSSTRCRPWSRTRTPPGRCVCPSPRRSRSTGKGSR
eukprot:scaffold14244_cov129-Isochrysis_galbana.AAC.4